MEFPIRQIAILIPAYKPDNRLLHLIDDLIASGFTSIIVIDDGSPVTCGPIFSEIERLTPCRLVRHAVNLGKGRAIKTGLNHLLTHQPETCGVVTCDADGQHLVADVMRVARMLLDNPESLILGVREFDSQVPLRSRLGNVITRGIFFLLIGKYLADTQTGLRGIPTSLIPALLRLGGEGYEFETNMLIAAKSHGLPILQESITTVYIENNRSSHFNPLLDSMKIYFLLLRFVASSLSASVLDFILFTICYKLTSSILLSLFVGRYIVGPFVNFVLNRNYVFHHTERLRATFIKYYLFATVMGLVTYKLILVVTEQLSVGVITAKIAVETLLFVISFTMQRDYIFSPKLATVGVEGRE